MRFATNDDASGTVRLELLTLLDKARIPVQDRQAGLISLWGCVIDAFDVREFRSNPSLLAKVVEVGFIPRLHVLFVAFTNSTCAFSVENIASWKFAVQILGRISEVALEDIHRQPAKVALTQLRDRASALSQAIRKLMPLIDPSHRSPLKGAVMQMIQALASDGPQHGLSTTSREVTEEVLTAAAALWHAYPKDPQNEEEVQTNHVIILTKALWNSMSVLMNRYNVQDERSASARQRSIAAYGIGRDEFIRHCCDIADTKNMPADARLFQFKLLYICGYCFGPTQAWDREVFQLMAEQRVMTSSTKLFKGGLRFQRRGNSTIDNTNRYDEREPELDLLNEVLILWVTLFSFAAKLNSPPPELAVEAMDCKMLQHLEKWCTDSATTDTTLLEPILSNAFSILLSRQKDYYNAAIGLSAIRASMESNSDLPGHVVAVWKKQDNICRKAYVRKYPDVAVCSRENCGKPWTSLGTALSFCAKCHEATYCSRECQVTDWKTHRRACAAANS